MDFDNRFDTVLVLAMNSFAGRSTVFDASVRFLGGENYLVKGAVFVSMFLWYWYQRGDSTQVRRIREHVLCSFGAAIVAIFIARALALSLPYRVRPRFEDSLHFRIPGGPDGTGLIDWSAFPSDNGAMFVALAVGLAFVSRRAGVVAFLYFLLAVAFPRMYLGLHYPTDMLAGMLIGAATGFAFNTDGIRKRLAAPAMWWENIAPSSFYIAFFVLCLELATMFDSVLGVALSVYHFLGRLIA
jgi:undecaprenyl-diphosphatase